MPAILAELDVQDVGSEKVRAYRDALTDLIDLNQRLATSTANLNTAMSGATTALGSIGSATAKATDDYADMAASMDTAAAAGQRLAAVPAVPPIPPSVIHGFAQLAEEVHQAGVAAVEAQQRIVMIGGAIQLLTTAMQAGQQASDAQAAAMRELAVIAQEGTTFTTQQAAAIEALNEKIAAGLPLTEADVAAMRDLAESYASANREALGLTSATEQLLQNQREQVAITHQTASAFGLLADQLGEGATVTRLQKDALAELAAAAQEVAGLADTDKQAILALNDAIQQGAVITPQHAAEIDRLSAALDEAAGSATAKTSALRDLIDAEQASMASAREAAQAGALLEAQMVEGAEVTAKQKTILDELNASIQNNGKFSDTTKTSVELLSQAVDVGTKFTAQHRLAMAGVNQQMREAVTTTSAATSSFDQFRVGAAALAAALAIVAGGLYSLLDRAGTAAARGEVLNTVLGRVAVNANESHIALEAQTQAVKALGITTDEAREAVIKFVQANLQAADASKVARVAQDLAVIANLNSSQAFGTLTQAIQSTQSRLLRQFGIVTSSTEIFGEYARSIGKSARELTEMEKKQAFVNKVLAEGEKVAGTYEASMNNVGKQMGSFKRVTDEAYSALGQALLPTMMLMVQTASSLLTWFTELDASTRAWVTALAAAGAAMATLSALIAGAKFIGLLGLLKSLYTGLMSVVTAYRAAAASAAIANVAMQQSFVVVGNSGAAIATLGDTAAKAAPRVGALSVAMRALMTALGGPWGVALAAAIAAVGLLTAGFVVASNAGVRSADEIRESYAKLEGQIIKSNDALKSLQDMQTRVQGLSAGKASSPTGDAIRQELLSRATEEYDKKLKSVTKSLEGYERELKIVAGASDTLAMRTDAVNAALMAQQEVIRNEAIAALESMKREQAGVNQELAVVAERSRIATAANGDMATALVLTNLALADQSSALSVNRGFWESLWALLKSAIIVGLQALWALVKKVGDIFVWAGGVLNDVFIKALQYLAEKLAFLAPLLNPIIAFLSDITGSVDRAARRFEALADSQNPERIEETRKALLAQAKALGVDMAAMQKLVDETDRGAASQKNLESAVSDATAAIAGGAGKIDDINKRMGEFASAGVKKQVEQLMAIRAGTRQGTVADVERLEAEITDAMEKWQGKRDADRKRAQDKALSDAKAHAEAVKALLGMGESETKQAKVLEEALTTARIAGGEKYSQILHSNASQILKLGSAAELAAAGFGTLAQAWEQAINIERIKTETAEANAMLAMERQIAEQRIEIQQSMQTRMAQMDRDWAADRYDNEIAMSRQIEDLDREIFERRLGRGKTAREAALAGEIHAEQQRVKAIARAIHDEIEQRERGLQAEQVMINERYRLAEQEIVNMTRQMEHRRQLRKLELEEQLEIAERGQDAAAIRMAKDRLEVHETFNRRYADLVQEQVTLTLDAAVKQRDHEQGILNQRTVQHERFKQVQLDALGRVVEESQESLSLIEQGYSQLYQLGREVWNGIVDVAVNGFSRMVQGTQSFKDTLLGIWQSIKTTLFQTFEAILKEWIKKQALMAAAANTKGGIGGILQSVGAFFTGGGATTTAQVAAGMPGAVAGLPTALGGTAATGGAAAGGLTTTALASGALSAGAGGLVGYGVGSQFDSRTAGGFAGAASGAATGALMGSILPGIGTVVGAVIGGVAGLIGGILGGGKEARAVANAREEYLKAKGGIEELKRQADEAGISIDRMLNTKKAKEFKDEVQRVEVAIMQNRFAAMHGGVDALKQKLQEAGINFTGLFEDPKVHVEELNRRMELTVAKLALIDSAGGLNNLRRSAELVGFELKRAFDATTIEAFNDAAAELNRLLEEQQKRLAGLGTAAQGLQQMITGFEQGLARGVKDALGDDTTQKLLAKFKEARERGFTGTMADFAGDLTNRDAIGNAEELLRLTEERNALAAEYAQLGRDLSDTEQDNLQKLADQIEEIRGRGPLLNEKDLQTIGQLTAKAQKEFNTLGLVASTVFARVLSETGDIVQAMQAVAEPLDRLIQLQRDWGFAAEETLGPLLAFRQVIKDNEDIANSLSGIVMVLSGMTTAGALGIEMFNALGSTAVANYDKLIERGVSADHAMLLMQPTLQALWEAQQRFHFETDEATQALIDQGVAQGIVGQHQKEINKQILDVLVLIAVALGADLPAAYRDAAAAAEDSARRQRDGLGGVVARARDARDAYWEMAHAAGEAGKIAEDAATGAAEGHSPTGLKQVVYRLNESLALYREWGDAAARAGRMAERAAADTYVGRPVELQRTGTDGGAPTINVTTHVSVNPNIQSMDGQDAERVWKEKIEPEMLRRIDHNTGQIAERISKSATRYKRGARH